MVIEAVLAVVAILGWACAVWFYVHLYRWARECQQARIVIAYKRKVTVDAPIVEWLLWIREANKDKTVGGRVIYQMSGTRVAILKRVKKPRRFRLRQPDAKQGKWGVARDDTKQSSQLSQVSHVTSKGG